MADAVREEDKGIQTLTAARRKSLKSKALGLALDRTRPRVLTRLCRGCPHSTPLSVPSVLTKMPSFPSVATLTELGSTCGLVDAAEDTSDHGSASSPCIAPSPLPVSVVRKLQAILGRLRPNNRLDKCVSV